MVARARSAATPGSVVVAAICVVLAGILVFAGIEATDNPTALTMTPDQVAKAEDLGSRTYATISGSIAATYVETYTDDNANGSQDAGETGTSWYYFLVDPTTKSGVTIRSRTSPKELFTIETSGVVLEDASYLEQDIKFFTEEATSLSFALDPSKLIDSTTPVSDTTPVLDLGDGIPAAMTPVRIVGSKAGGYLETCSKDSNGNGICEGRRSTSGMSRPTTPRAGPGSSCSSTRTPSTRRRRSPGCSAAMNGT